MLTIEEIKDVKFHKAGKNGYNVDDVESFIDQVVASFEQLNAEKNELVRKMGILAKKIEQYREDEETVRNALITTQKLSDSTIKEANEKAAQIIKAAEKKSRAILLEAEKATEREKDRFEAVHGETARLRKEIIALYKKHLIAVEELPTDEDVKARRAELDEKYPAPQPEKKSVDPVIEEEVPAEVAQTPVEETHKEDDEPTIRVELQRETSDKFKGLKFGDNYDVE